MVALIATGAGLLSGTSRSPEFPHDKHVRLFPGTCATCHAGVSTPGETVMPAPVTCTACHDGTVERVVRWTPPAEPPPSNLRFRHDAHARATADSVTCAQCHLPGDPKADVHRARAVQCVSCHVPGAGHLEVAGRACATCHVALAAATRLSPQQVAAFPVPPSHRDPQFRLAKHGKLSDADAPDGATCSTCHARNFCVNCHVNAPEVRMIQALALDARSLQHRFTFGAPPSHDAVGFATGHGRDAARAPARCATCHTQASCSACHVNSRPRAVTVMPVASAGRATGARVTRARPASHTAQFREGHGPQASARPTACATCHARTECLACHRGVSAQSPVKSGYHPITFLARHPAAAYARQTTCSDCHNTQQFCASCHRQSGLGGGNTIGGATYHDGKAAFFVGHGRAARQSLENCVSCHAERDCTACHAAQGGRRFSPHGPGFNGETLRRRNPEMCIACHGRAIPTRSH